MSGTDPHQLELLSAYTGEEGHAWTSHARSVESDPFFWHVNRPVIESLLPAMPSVILDVGAGEGRMSRIAQGAGHAVIAVDRSFEMGQYSKEAGVRMVVGGAAQQLPIRTGSVDCVLSVMLLMSLAELTKAVGEARRVLRQDGVAIFAVIHPLASAGYILGNSEMVVRDYGRERALADQTKERSGGALVYRHFHRTFSTYMNVTMGAGLRIERVVEPIATDVSLNARLERWKNFPQSLIWRARKALSE